MDAAPPPLEIPPTSPAASAIGLAFGSEIGSSPISATGANTFDIHVSESANLCMCRKERAGRKKGAKNKIVVLTVFWHRIVPQGDASSWDPREMAPLVNQMDQEEQEDEIEVRFIHVCMSLTHV
ncbi:unnamed protein product [Ectocarpus sp. 12 AP-2014]